MVRHGKTKKRRAARTGRSTLKNRNYQFYKPPRIDDDAVRAAWDPRKSPAQNMASMGLQAAINSSVVAPSHAPDGPPPDGVTAVELFDVPASDDVNAITLLPGKTYAQRKLPVSVDDQKYICACLAAHGDDYRAMSRDIKTNDMQHTAAKLKKMAARFYLLAKEHVRVDVPERVRHLMTCLREEGGEQDGDERK